MAQSVSITNKYLLGKIEYIGVSNVTFRKNMWASHGSMKKSDKKKRTNERTKGKKRRKTKVVWVRMAAAKRSKNGIINISLPYIGLSHKHIKSFTVMTRNGKTSNKSDKSTVRTVARSPRHSYDTHVGQWQQQQRTKPTTTISTEDNRLIVRSVASHFGVANVSNCWAA